MIERNKSRLASGIAAGTVAAMALGSASAWAQGGGDLLNLPRQGSYGQVPGLVTFPDGAYSTDRLLGGQRAVTGAARRGSGTAVLDRPRPDYDPQGIRAGGFTLYPLVTLSANGTNNVFRQTNGVGDVFLRSGAEVVARSDWALHRLSFGGGIQQRTFSKYSSEDTTNYNAQISGDLDVRRGVRLNAGAAFKHDYVNRNSVDEIILTRSPVRFDELRLGTGGSVAVGRWGIGLDLGYTKRDYADARSPAGAFISEQFRDYQSYSAGLTLGYALPGGQQIFVSGNFEDRNFRVLSNPDRDVQIIEVLAGISSDITPLISGRAGFGYIQANFDAVGVSKRGGLAVDVELSYLFTELTTFSLTARRQLTNVSTPTAPAAFNTRIDLVANHELLRNVILSPGLVYNRSDYLESPLHSQFFGGKFAAKWLINRRLRADAEAAVGRSRSNSLVAAQRAANVSGRVGLTFQL